MDNSPSLNEIADFVQRTAEQMRRFGLTTVDVNSAGTRIKIRIASVPAAMPKTPLSAAPFPTESEIPDEPVETTATHDIEAPMIGTFFAAGAPDEPPYVEVGDVVSAGQTIGIIEAMKIMNEIAADRSGTVIEVFVKNAQAVEYGQRLMRIEPIDE